MTFRSTSAVRRWPSGSSTSSATTCRCSTGRRATPSRLNLRACAPWPDTGGRGRPDHAGHGPQRSARGELPRSRKAPVACRLGLRRIDSPLFDLATCRPAMDRRFDGREPASGLLRKAAGCGCERAFAAMKCASLLRETLWGGVRTSFQHRLRHDRPTPAITAQARSRMGRIPTWLNFPPQPARSSSAAASSAADRPITLGKLGWRDTVLLERHKL